MKKKQTLYRYVASLLIVLAVLPFVVPTIASAATCGGVTTSIISCSEGGGTETEESGLWGILIITINILTAGVGVLALAGIVYGSVLYTSAGGSPEQIKKARTIFTNVVVGLIAFAAMWGLLNFLIPGGVFNV